MAYGASHKGALANAEEAVQLWLEAARELGRPTPQPEGLRLAQRFDAETWKRVTVTSPPFAR